jgi:hypothetical protein
MVINVNLDVAAIANAIVWPVLVGIVIIRYRNNIGEFLKNVTPRINKLSVGPVSLELENTTGFTPQWEAFGNFNFMQTGIAGFQSVAPDLLNQIVETAPLDYAVFNLGDGTKWLSSRLYLFTVILRKIRKLRAIIFVDTKQGIKHHFVGFASPEQLEDALFRRYPFLIAQFAFSFDNLQRENIIGTDGLLSSNVSQLINNYINDIKFQNTPDGPATPTEGSGYVQLSDGTWEYAEWIDTSKIEEILAGTIDKSNVNKLELDTKSKEDQLKLILAFNGTFVAMVDQNQQFVTLIDRHRFVEKAARQYVQRMEETHN